MREVFIVGVGMTAFGLHADKSTGDMARSAVLAALKDADAQPGDVGATFYANTAGGAIEGQFGIKGQHALRPIGIQGGPLVNVENACYGSSTALNLAIHYVASGQAEVGLAAGTEKLNTEDREKRKSAFGQPLDVAGVTKFVKTYSELVADIQPPPSVEIDPKMYSLFMDAYSINARLHMKKYGTTWEQMAQVAAKNHHHSTMNPLAQFQKDFPVEKILASKVIAWPLTLPMCSPISDGAAAVVVCSREVLDRFNAKRAVKVLSSVMRSGTDRDINDVENAALRVAAKRAFAEAGLTPKDISVAEVHDASAYAEINQIELVGFCDIGEGGRFTASGATALGGSIPVNVSGGLESRGHPVAATGAAQIHELVLQLRGEAGARQVDGASTAVAACSGGFLGVEDSGSCVTILSKA